MNLDELRSVQRAERQKDSLQHLRDEFYENVAAYVAQLKDERERAVAAADDPFSSEDVRQLTDKIESTKETANALYERRVGKVVKHASFAAADMATDEEGMTTEERELFTDLVARIRENRQTVLSTLDGDAGRSTDESATEADAETEPGSDRAVDSDTPVDAPARQVGADTGGSEPSATEPTDDLLADALGDAGTDAIDGTPAAGSEVSDPGSPPGPEAPPDEERSEGAAPASANSASAVDDDSLSDLGGDPDRPADEARAVSDGPATDSSSVEAARRESVASGGSATTDATAVETESAGGTPDTDRTTLKITADVGTVYGVDEREYDLAREDVVTLPTTNAEPLLQKNAAERIDFD
jgi:DNA replication factor GINS